MSQSALPMLGARQMFPMMTQADIDRLRRFGESKFYETGERIAPGLSPIRTSTMAPLSASSSSPDSRHHGAGNPCRAPGCRRTGTA